MSPDGAGSQRIVVIGRAGHPQPLSPAPAPAAREREAPAQRERSAKKRVMQHNGWTLRRLTVAGALGAGATLLGGVMFIAKFGVLGGSDSPVLAMSFGLFVIGMVVFCAALIALLGSGIGIVAERRGWSTAAGIVFAPLALIWLLHLVGAVGYAVPAVISLALIGGLVVALK
jgi:hypothetical protein